MSEDHIPDTAEELIGEVEHVVSMKPTQPPKAACTCGWETTKSTMLFELATAAFKHSEETGHSLRHHEYKS